MPSIISARLLSSPAAQPRVTPYDIRDSRLRGFILRVQPSGVRVYYVQLARGKRERIGLVGEYTPDEARERCELMLGNYAHGRPVRAGLLGAGTLPTFGQYVADTYAAFQRGQYKTAEGTLARIALLFCDWNNVQLDQITPELIDRWKAKRLAEGGSKATLMRDLQCLSGVMQHAYEVGRLISENPVRRVTKPTLDSGANVRYLSDAELARLRAALIARDTRLSQAAHSADATRMRKARGKSARRASTYFDHLTPAVLLTINTGLRLGELLALRWDSVNFKLGLLTIHGGTTKNQKTRHIPLNREALAVLRTWHEQRTDAERVFPFAGGFKTAWGKLLKAANVTNFRWHDLRHHFASMLAQRGRSLNVIRELLGHGSLAMVLRYAHLSPNETRAAVDSLNAS